MSGTYVQYPPSSSGGGSGSGSISFSVGVLDGQSANARGASVSSNSIFMQSATGTWPGVVSSAAQTFAGPKTFTGTPLVVTANTNSQAPPTGTNIHIIGGNNALNRVVLDSHNQSSAATAPGFILRRSRGTANAPQNVQGDDALGFVGASGYGATGYSAVTAGTMAFKAETDWTDASQPTYFQISLNNSSSTSVFTRMVMTSAGFVRWSAYMHQTGPLFSTGSGGGIVSGSVSLSNQVSGLLPESNIGSTSAPYNVGPLDGAAASVNGGVIGSESLYFQSASVTAPGLINVSSAQSFTGLKNFTQVAVNSPSATAAMTVTASGLATSGLVIRPPVGSTGDSLEVLDPAGNPRIIYDQNSGQLKLFHNATTAEAPLDMRTAATLATVNSGSAARYNFFLGNTASTAAGIGQGIALGGSSTNASTQTEYGVIWVTKDNGTAGDVDSTMHFAPRNNSLNKFYRALSLTSNGTSVFGGPLKITGSVSGAVTVNPPAVTTPYTLTLPAAQGAANSWLRNDGSGTLSWVATNPTYTIITNLGTQTYSPPANCRGMYVYCTGGGGGGGGVQSSGTAGVGATGCGAGGGAGGTAIGWVVGSAISGSYSIIIGSGGPGGGAAAAGATGSLSSFVGNGINLSANGGLGGSGHTSTTATPILVGGGSGAGVGGTTTGLLTYDGLSGNSGFVLGINGNGSAGQGGSSFYGSGGVRRATAGQGGFPGTTTYGAGGGGGMCVGSSASYSGGDGRQGAVYIIEFYD